jgi:Ala-tRNA(Pro) deacylase
MTTRPHAAAAAGPDAATDGTHQALLDLLRSRRIDFRLLDHAPEGRTADASSLRGHPLSQAAKCMVVEVALADGTRRYVLAVVPGDTRVNLKAVRRLLRGRDARLADAEVAERLSGCRVGTVMPLSFNPELELVVDPALLAEDRLYFNAARLDRSVVIGTADYLALTEPRIEPVADRRQRDRTAAAA